MKIAQDEHVIVYWDSNGQVLSCGGRQASVMTLLDKLGLKTIPTKNCTMWTTHWTLDPGNYTVAYNVSGNTVNVDLTIAPPTYVTYSIDIDDVKIEEPIKEERKPTKDMRRQWRQTERMHSRNTGRKTGRR